jgi:hypothetical protein
MKSLLPKPIKGEGVSSLNQEIGFGFTCDRSDRWWPHLLDKLIVNEVFVLYRKLFNFLYLFLIELRTYQRQTLCGILTESRFLKQDFNESRSSLLDSWLSWIGFYLIVVGSREFDSKGSHQTWRLIQFFYNGLTQPHNRVHEWWRFLESYRGRSL